MSHLLTRAHYPYDCLECGKMFRWTGGSKAICKPCHEKKSKMELFRDDSYARGYRDGRDGISMSPDRSANVNYVMGYIDAKADADYALRGWID